MQDFDHKSNVQNFIPGASVFFFNPSFEEQVSRSKPGYTAPSKVLSFQNDYQHIMMFLAKASDAVFSNGAPSTRWLEGLRALGFPIPTFISGTSSVEDLETALSKTKSSCFKPWGWSPDIFAMLKASNGLNKKSTLPPNYSCESLSSWGTSIPSPNVLKKYVSKEWSVELRKNFCHQSNAGDIFDTKFDTSICLSSAAAIRSVESIGSIQGSVLKSPFGSSGNNQMRIDCRNPIDSSSEKWIKKIIKLHGSILVEPLYRRIQDFGIQLNSSGPRNSSYKGTLIFETTLRGQHRSHTLGNQPELIDPQVHEGLKRRNLKFSDLCRQISDFAYSECRRIGYLGPAGIDIFAYADANRDLKIRPFVEINMRHTMGHIGLAIENRIHSDSSAIWLHTNLKEVLNNGFSSIEEFARELEGRFPADRLDSKISKGVFFTNDPTIASTSLGLVIVGSTTDINRVDTRSLQLIPSSL